MRQIKLIIPGLTGPFSSDLPGHILSQFKQSEFDQLNRCLSRANMSFVPANNYFTTLVSEIAPRCQAGLCELTATYDDIDLSGGYFYRADPVHFKAESDHAILLGAELISPSLGEAQALVNVFNQHFKEDGISLLLGSQARWYMKCDRPLELDFFALDYSLGRDIKHFMPKGKDELWWRKVVNEAQMLFFQHALNEQRESTGQLSINGLWLWDVSVEQPIADTEQEDVSGTTVFSGDVVAIALAKQTGLTVKPVELLSAGFQFSDRNLLVYDQLYMPVCYGDIDAWFESVEIFCKTTLSLLYDLLKRRVIDEVVIYPCDGRVFRLDRLQLAKLWRPVKSVDQFVRQTS